MKRKIAYISGATSGIGRATACKMAAAGMDLVIMGRREDRLQDIQQTIIYQGVDCHYLSFDISDRKQTENAISALPDRWKPADILINNAGNAHGLDDFDCSDPDDWDAMIGSNVKGLLYLTRQVVPDMVRHTKGHIILVGSIAGKEVYEKGHVYCATKHAVDALAKGMRMDLLPKGIKVSAIHPGLVDTEFSPVRFKGDLDRAQAVYKGMKPLSAEDVAEVILYMIQAPAHINLADVVLLPSDQASATRVKRTPGL